MSNHNKTLADVQPGGRVRLGDQGERARFKAWWDAARPLEGSAFPYEIAWAAWQAALSAQPSPGGQGDAHDCLAATLGDLLLRGWIDDVSGKLIGEAARKDMAAALAARQPSKQPDSVALGEATEFCIEKGDRQPVGQKAVVISHWRDGELNHILYCSPMPDGVHRLYAAPTAQVVDLGKVPHGIRLVEIPRRNGLDPINVFVQDYELGRGRIVVTCYGQAWCGFWGAMGDRTVMQFVAACDADYVAGNMLSGRHEHVKKHERTYVERIATEVIAEFRALIDDKAVRNG
ncbi:hypothetical protein [Stenotrophomonas maltophilia]|uniref:hypothetical protein n=1 Tax=Stenotrophomonas maltophilia TaxID=40324 RepID=UPI0012B1396E|nr:hypothetical protein [Stenotrophomonas maltophilia]QGM07112.1 hypothetical protein FEO88_20660 [Stenotrophomonas maltophilia]